MADELRVSSGSESDLILTLRGPTDVVEPPSDKSYIELELDDQSEDENQGNVKVCCFIWKNGRVGAAYYSLEEKMLYVYEEMVDLEPYFFFTRCLYTEIDPTYALVIGSKSDLYVKVLMEIMYEAVDETTTTISSVKNLPPNLFLLSSKEINFEACINSLCNLALATHNENSESEKQLHINTLINFDDKLSVFAASALSKYLDQNWAHFISNKDNLQFLHIEQMTMKNNVLLDWSTLNALQIFQQRTHDASFKRGLQDSTHEGVSIYKSFSSNCVTKLGLICLKRILLNPVKNINELTKRLDFISFVVHPSNQEFVESLQDNLKKIFDVHALLFRIQNSQATFRNWKALYMSIYHTVFVRELCSPYIEGSEVLRDFHNSVSQDLIMIEVAINNAIDFSISKSSGRPILKMGIDNKLDAKKLKRDDISKHVTGAARMSVEQLPQYINECAIVHLPEMGHLISVKEWEPNCDPKVLDEFGFQYMFKLSENLHYKNAVCYELDRSLGDINAEIIEHETRVLQRLALFILKFHKHVRAPLKPLSLIDALISMGKVALQNNYVRPTLNNDNIHEIENCRHPLLELTSHCEENNFHSGGPGYSHIKILTGPNGSGKSVYLKQIATIIYLAHVGSFVPAKNANIGMTYSIHSRMQATESASVRLSAFMIDLTQMTQTIHNSKPNSFVLLDEFGRGTVEEQGLALLLGVLRYFRNRKENCPHVLVSSHFQNFGEYLPAGTLVDYIQMTYSIENGRLIYLFKVANGVAASLGIKIAKLHGIHSFVIRRAIQFEQNGFFDTLPCPKFRQYERRDRTKHEMLEFLSTSEIAELAQIFTEISEFSC